MARQAFSGSIVAIVTPFHDDRVDFPALKRLCDWHIAEGTQAILPCGTTGESATFSHEEQHQATACYNKPTPEGLFQHFKAVREATRLPLVLYNVPGRTGINMLPETTERVWGLGNIDAIKEASGSPDQITDLLARGVRVLSGDDSMTLPYMALGASGVISVVANFAPRLMRQLCDACARADLVEARRINHIVFELVKVAFSETNPIPAKAAVHALGLCREEYRLPIVPMTPAKRAVLIATLTRYGLLARANA
jgi:4-hydroxy-tetrahydrodipicolinate synthase